MVVKVVLGEKSGGRPNVSTPVPRRGDTAADFVLLAPGGSLPPEVEDAGHVLNPPRGPPQASNFLGRCYWPV